MWATTLIPANKVFTGNIPRRVIVAPDGSEITEFDVEPPFARIARTGGTITRSSSGACEDVNIQIEVYATDLDDAKAAAAEVKARFNRCEFAYAGGQVDDARMLGQSEQQGLGEVWIARQQWLFRTQET